MTKRTEEFKVSGSDVVKKIKELVKQGNIRKITIKDKEGKTFAEFPLTLGVVGTVILPVVAAIGTIIALVAECTISVEKEEDAKDKEIIEKEEREGKDPK
ncbi:MAG TPA: DUF4342 domain-containing protein [Patescibacteria group bacterium]|nr:DUF4342 domain-containing protein [Patescibacteria group bacterium]